MTPEQRAAAAEDGIFNGGGKPLVGRAAIEQFYSWRQDRGARTSRHVISIADNFNCREP